MEESSTMPKWAPRVAKRMIRQLYETDAMGIYDEELIAEVGYSLLSRCESFIDANEARAGRARCPQCSTIVEHTGGKGELLRCACGWVLSWGEYFETTQRAQLSGAEPVLEQFRAFVSTFPTAGTPQEKMLAIDRLIHGFHWHYKTNSPTRPVAVNLIEGRLKGVVAFLDRLTYSDKSTPGTREVLSQWEANIDLNREWYGRRS